MSAKVNGTLIDEGKVRVCDRESELNGKILEIVTKQDDLPPKGAEVDFIIGTMMAQGKETTHKAMGVKKSA